MSNHPMNYLPFDYTRFTSELLPLLDQAREGNTMPLENLMRSTQHISLWNGLKFMEGWASSSVMHEPIPWSAERAEYLIDSTYVDVFAGQLKVDRRVKFEQDGFDPWLVLLKEVPALVGKDFAHYDEAARALCCYLLFTFCCDVPSDKRERPAIFEHEEQTFRWQNYITENEEIAPLWDLFHQPPPPDLAAPFLTSHPSSVHLGPTSPRQLEIFGFNHIIVTGFITPEEAQYLLAHLQTHRQGVSFLIYDGYKLMNPYNWSSDAQPPQEFSSYNADQEYQQFYPTYQEFREACVAYSHAVYQQWMREHPAHMTDLLQECLPNYVIPTWHLEDQVMEYLRYAVSRGWGLLEFYD